MAKITQSNKKADEDGNYDSVKVLLEINTECNFKVESQMIIGVMRTLHLLTMIHKFIETYYPHNDNCTRSTWYLRVIVETCLVMISFNLKCIKGFINVFVMEIM